MAKPKYEPLDYYSETVLDAGVAIRQAAMALDVVAYNAVESKDNELLTAVAGMWMKMAESLESEDEEKPEEKKNGQMALGFKFSKEEDEDGESS